MDIPRFYGYLIRARRDLWATLEQAPEGVLGEPHIPGERFHCIKDLLVHMAAVEDSWLNEDILRVQGHWESVPAIAAGQDGPHYATTPLADILAYWRTVEVGTQTYLAQLTPSELARRVTLHDDENVVLVVEDILWHVLLHEVRHTAQIILLLRQAGLKPPQLDLLFYLPLGQGG